MWKFHIENYYHKRTRLHFVVAIESTSLQAGTDKEEVRKPLVKFQMLGLKIG